MTKPSILGLPLLGLMIASVAFGASTIYLGIQLREERARADQFTAESRALQARIQELEKARQHLDDRLFTGGAVTGDGSARMDLPEAAAPPPAVGEQPAPPATGTAGTAIASPMPERSPAFEKMRRSQVRAINKRLYSDIGDKLGLSKADTGRLIDLLTDQRLASMEGARVRMNNSSADPRAISEAARQELSAIADLIGQDKMEQFKDYQETLPARQEVEMLSRQLEGADLELSKSQRDRLVTALAEERRRVPTPTLANAPSREDYAQAMAAWHEDYNERATSRARSILVGEQLGAYEEYQQWSREMRQRSEARRAARGGGDVLIPIP
jgi:hypothetical protein